MQIVSKPKKEYGTSLERVEYLTRRISKTVNREQANVGEAKLAGENHIQNMIEKFSTYEGMEIPKKLVNDLVRHIDTKKANIIESKLVAELYIQCIINEQGEDIPMPDMIVSDRDGKTVFEFIDGEK